MFIRLCVIDHLHWYRSREVTCRSSSSCSVSWALGQKPWRPIKATSPYALEKVYVSATMVPRNRAGNRCKSFFMLPPIATAVALKNSHSTTTRLPDSFPFRSSLNLHYTCFCYILPPCKPVLWKRKGLILYCVGDAPPSA